MATQRIALHSVKPEEDCAGYEGPCVHPPPTAHHPPPLDCSLELALWSEPGWGSLSTDKCTAQAQGPQGMQVADSQKVIVHLQE